MTLRPARRSCAGSNPARGTKFPLEIDQLVERSLRTTIFCFSARVLEFRHTGWSQKPVSHGRESSNLSTRTNVFAQYPIGQYENRASVCHQWGVGFP